MPEVIWLNTYSFTGSYEPHYNRIEICSHFPEELKQEILNHELEHARLWKKRGFLSLPQQIWLDYKQTFKIFSTPKLVSQIKKRKPKLYHSKKERVKIAIFGFCYAFTMSLGNPIMMLSGSIISLGKKLHAKLQ